MVIRGRVVVAGSLAQARQIAEAERARSGVIVGIEEIPVDHGGECDAYGDTSSNGPDDRVSSVAGLAALRAGARAAGLERGHR